MDLIHTMLTSTTPTRGTDTHNADIKNWPMDLTMLTSTTPAYGPDTHNADINNTCLWTWHTMLTSTLQNKGSDTMLTPTLKTNGPDTMLTSTLQTNGSDTNNADTNITNKRTSHTIPYLISFSSFSVFYFIINVPWLVHRHWLCYKFTVIIIIIINITDQRIWCTQCWHQ